MKNKTKTYILIVLVLGIWGTIGYKIITGLSPNLPVSVEDNLLVSFSPEKIKKLDTFSIQTVDRDPFLGTIRRTDIKKKSTNTFKRKQSNINSKAQIDYLGLIKNHNSSQQVFIININGKQNILKKGQVVENVKLLQGNSREIVISQNGERHVIKLL